MTAATVTAADFSTETLIIIGRAFVSQSAIDPEGIANDVRTLQQNVTGQELLRLIVRDDLGGAGAIIANALWVNL